MSSYRQFAAVYDRLMEEMPYPEWLRFTEQCWERYGVPSTIVDLGCGTGSIAIPLAISGYNLYGIDLSDNMLAIAHRKWEETPQRAVSGGKGKGSIQWLQQDMSAWELPQQVDAVLSFCDCLNYLTEETDIQAVFRSTYGGLKDGGVFIFDVHAPSTLHAYAKEQPFLLDEEDVSYIWTAELDEERLEIEHNLTIFAKDAYDSSGRYVRIDETHVQRAYDPEWLYKELLAAGFSKVDRYADFQLGLRSRKLLDCFSLR